MAVMGLRLAQRANGVSRLHGAVSREMFHGLWPGFDTSEVPITSITNGVHAPTWVDPRVVALGEKYIGPGITLEARQWEQVERIPDEEVWAVRRQMRAGLVEDARRRVRSSWLKRGASPAELGWVDSVLDPDVLTIGFARRVPTYKRLTLMLRDPDRLRALLLHPTRPVQIVIAGKSHPADDNGKRLIQQMVRFTDDPSVRHRIVVLPNYDIGMAQTLYPGCDVWLNNPVRPLEASGTSGMKAALNGGLNLSIRDGWWDEWYDGENGWAIPTADGIDDPDHRDDLEAAALYDLVENSVAPRFYDRDPRGLPVRWLEMVRHTLASLGPKVLATRMVADYVHKLYVPAAQAAQRASFDYARSAAAFKDRVRSEWYSVRVDHVESLGVSDSPQVGDEILVRAVVSLGQQLGPRDVDVQLVYGRVSPSDTLTDLVTAPLAYVEEVEPGRYRFEGTVRLRRTGPFGYTVRVLPSRRGRRLGGRAGPGDERLLTTPAPSRRSCTRGDHGRHAGGGSGAGRPVHPQGVRGHAHDVAALLVGDGGAAENSGRQVGGAVPEQRVVRPPGRPGQPHVDRRAGALHHEQQRLVDVPAVPVGHHRVQVHLQRAQRRVVPALVRHLRALGTEPCQVLRAVGVHGPAREEAVLTEHRVVAPQPQQVRGGLDQGLLLGAEAPVDPRGLVVEAVRVVVAALGAAQLVTGRDHGDAGREQQGAEQVACRPPPRREHAPDRTSAPRRRGSTSGCRRSRRGCSRRSPRCA